MAQAGDVILFQTVDGGNIIVENGITQMTGGLETAVYLSLFAPADWHGNDTVDDNNERMQSQTEEIITGKPQTSKNYQLLDQAIQSDLKWLTADKIETSVSAAALNRVNINISITQDSNDLNLTIPVEWGNNGG